jgi:hypothetical protein
MFKRAACLSIGLSHGFGIRSFESTYAIRSVRGEYASKPTYAPHIEAGVLRLIGGLKLV